MIKPQGEVRMPVEVVCKSQWFRYIVPKIKAGRPCSKATRLSLQIRCFPTLPLGRYGFLSVQNNNSYLLIILYLSINSKTGTKTSEQVTRGFSRF